MSQNSRQNCFAFLVTAAGIRARAGGARTCRDAGLGAHATRESAGTRYNLRRAAAEFGVIVTGVLTALGVDSWPCLSATRGWSGSTCGV